MRIDYRAECINTIVIGGGQAGPLDRVSPEEAWRAVPHSGCLRPRGGRLAHSAGTRFGSSRPPSSRGSTVCRFPHPPLVPDEGRDGELPGNLRAHLRVAGPNRRARGAPLTPGQRVPRRGRRAAVRGGERDRRHVPLPAAAGSAICRGACDGHRATALRRYLSPAAVAARPRAGRGAGNSGAEIALEVGRGASA